MATAGPLRIPIVVDGRSAVASFSEVQQAAQRARQEIADQVAGSARIQATAGTEAAELERRRIALVLQGIEDTTERRVAAINLTSALEAQAVEKLIAARLRAGEIDKQQAASLRAEFDRVGEAARQAQIGRVETQVGGVATQGRNAGEAMLSLARGIEDASYAGGNFTQIVRYSANNVSQFVTQLGYAKAEADRTGQSLGKSLVGALAGPAGLVVAIGVATAAVQYFGDDVARALGIARDEFEATREQVAEWAAELYDVRVDLDTSFAVTSAEDLEDALALAREELAEMEQDERSLILALSGSTGALGTNVDKLALFIGGSREAKRAVREMGDEVAAQEAVVRELSDALEEYRRKAAELNAARPVDFAADPSSFVVGESEADRRRRVQEEERDRDRAARAADRRAESERRRAERRQETLARQAARKEQREAEQAAREQAALRNRLAVEGRREGFEREREQLRQQRAERLAVARGDAQLALAVEAQYERDLDALRRGYAERAAAVARRVFDERLALAERVAKLSGATEVEVAEARVRAYEEAGYAAAEAAVSLAEARVEAAKEATDEILDQIDRETQAWADAEVERIESEKRVQEARVEAAERAAERVLTAALAEVTRRRRFTEVDVELTRERYRQEEKALRESLREREISQREYSLEMRALAQDRAEFEAEVAEDSASRIAAALLATVAVARDVAVDVIKTELAKAAALAITDAIGKLGVFGIPIALASIPAVFAIETVIRGAAGFAEGGAVVGPGGPTEDRVPAWLSAGEHVVTAREVAAMGGHDEVLRWRRLAAAGALPRFALGGPVPTRVPLPARSTAAPATTSAPAAFDLAPVLDELRETRRQLVEAKRNPAPVLVGERDARRFGAEAAKGRARQPVRFGLAIKRGGTS